MRATVDAKEFSQALDKVSKVPKKSSDVPVLREVLVRFSGGTCTLTGTDWDTWMIAEIPAQGDDLSFVFHRTADVAKACRHFDGDLSFEMAGVGDARSRRMRLCMSCGHRAGELKVFPAEDYPKPPELETEQSFTVNAARLLARIDRIKYASNKPGQNADVQRTSVQFSGDRIFCLDGFRAAWDTDETLSVPVPFMVPVTSLEYLKLFGDRDVSVHLGTRYVDISDGTLHIRVCRVGARVFDLDNAIPDRFQEEICVYPKDFLTELSYLKEIVPNARMTPVRLEGGRLFICVDGYRYQTKIEMDGRSETLIGFNLNYLTDALRQFKGEPCVRMKLGSPFPPVVLEAEGRHDRALLLPVRLSESMAA